MISDADLAAMRERWPADQTYLTMQALPDIQSLLDGYAELRALAVELADAVDSLLVMHPCGPGAQRPGVLLLPQGHGLRICHARQGPRGWLDGRWAGMSDERVEHLRAVAERDIAWDSELIEALGIIDALQAQTDAANARAARLEAALRMAREALEGWTTETWTWPPNAPRSRTIPYAIQQHHLAGSERALAAIDAALEAEG